MSQHREAEYQIDLTIQSVSLNKLEHRDFVYLMEASPEMLFWLSLNIFFKQFTGFVFFPEGFNIIGNSGCYYPIHFHRAHSVSPLVAASKLAAYLTPTLTPFRIS